MFDKSQRRKTRRIRSRPSGIEDSPPIYNSLLPDQCNIPSFASPGSVKKLHFQCIGIYIHWLNLAFHAAIPTQQPVFCLKYFLPPPVPDNEFHFSDTKTSHHYYTVHITPARSKCIGNIQCRHDQYIHCCAHCICTANLVECNKTGIECSCSIILMRNICS